jgi:pyruvate dehydrogenase E2 component (dihydrolipoamide acetyltransferase)
MIDIVVPQISEVASEIVLVRWLKAEGDAVRKGEPLFELDTDKYVVEIEAFEDGTLTQVVVAAGSVVEPGQVVARLAGAGELPNAETSPPPPPPVHEAQPAAPAGADGDRRERKVLASPKARRLARELGVDVSALSGTGSGGLVTSDDVRDAAAEASPHQPAGLDVEPLSHARRAIGIRMQESKRTVPHFYVMVDVDMGEAVRLRSRCVDELGWEKPPTFTDLIVAACARALRASPDTNVRLEDGGLRRRASVDIGIAVGFEEGLVVPVIQEADKLTLQALSSAARAAAERARSGRLLGSDLAERSMVVSNLGMHGVDVFIAIVDVPDPMILAAGRVAERCVVVDGVPAVTWGCTLTLSADHRVLDGFAAARFVGEVKSELENAYSSFAEEA